VAFQLLFWVVIDGIFLPQKGTKDTKRNRKNTTKSTKNNNFIDKNNYLYINRKDFSYMIYMINKIFN